MHRILKNERFWRKPQRGKNDSLSQFERKTTQRKDRKPGSAPKVRFQESMFAGKNLKSHSLHRPRGCCLSLVITVTMSF